MTAVVTVKNLDDEVVELEQIINGQTTVISFLRHFG